MTLWQARQVAILMGDAVTAISSSTSLYSQIVTTTLSIESVAKEISFTEPERATEIVKLLGSTSGNQNSELDEKAPEMAEFTGTLILNPDKIGIKNLEKYKLTSTTAPTNYTRFNYASAAPTAGVAVAIKFSNGVSTSGQVSEVTFLMNNCSISSLGGFSIDADGHAEQEITVSCTADDCYKEWKTNT